MAKETVGFVRLEWTCPNCGTRNPGPQKTCASCGFAQPENIQFEQSSGAQLIADEAEVARAKKGPDIQCFFCGTRNPADATTCSQCGGDITQGTARQSGQTLGAYKTGPVEQITCPACGAKNPANAPKCASCGAAIPKAAPPPQPAVPTPKPVNRGLLIGIGLAFVAILAVCAFLLFSTNESAASVQSVNWTRSIGIEGLAPVQYDAWREDIPAGAVVGTCTQKIHHTQDDPAPNSEKICGTPYTVDQGSGFGQVVQDCRYQVYADYCGYTVEEWREIDRVTLSGSDYNPRWPANFQLGFNQREGSRAEEYQIHFNADGKEYIHTTADVNLFNQAQIGSRWILEINKLGALVGIKPAE